MSIMSQVWRQTGRLSVLQGGVKGILSGFLNETAAASNQMIPNRSFQSGQGKSFVSESTAATQTQTSQRIEKTVNHITLMGRVGADPQKRGTQEHPVVVFSMATHSNYNYQSGSILQKTDWHRICVFKPYLRDTVYKYLNKGQRIYVTGRISYGEIKDDSGNSHTTTSIIADDVIFVSSPGGAAAKPAEEEVY